MTKAEYDITEYWEVCTNNDAELFWGDTGAMGEG